MCDVDLIINLHQSKTNPYNYLRMASYEEDHGITSQRSSNINSSSSRNNNSNNDNETHGNHRILLSQQPDLTSFFNMDREDEDNDSAAAEANRSARVASMMNNNSVNTGDQASRDHYARALLGALSQYADDSDVARELVQQLQQEIGENNNNGSSNNNSGTRSNNTEHQAALFQNIMAAANATSFAQGIVSGNNPFEDFNDSGSKKSGGVSQEYLDGLDRVSKKKLKKDDKCPICATAFLEDEYPLVVQLPCSNLHRFDLECIAPWLTLHPNCPMCRKDLLKKKEVEKVVPDDEEEEEEFDDLYG